MNHATIGISGVGRVEIRTDAKAVSLAGAFTQDGQPVNVCLKKVSRSLAHQRPAALASASYWLREVQPGIYRLETI